MVFPTGNFQLPIRYMLLWFGYFRCGLLGKFCPLVLSSVVMWIPNLFHIDLQLAWFFLFGFYLSSQVLSMWWPMQVWGLSGALIRPPSVWFFGSFDLSHSHDVVGDMDFGAYGLGCIKSFNSHACFWCCPWDRMLLIYLYWLGCHKL